MPLYMDIHRLDGPVSADAWPRPIWPTCRCRTSATSATSATGLRAGSPIDCPTEVVDSLGPDARQPLDQHLHQQRTST